MVYPKVRQRLGRVFRMFWKIYTSDLGEKIGRSANREGGGGQPFNSQYSLTDHQKDF